MGASFSREQGIPESSIRPEDVTFDGTILGEGSFGVVKKGTWLAMPVAVKNLAPGAASADPSLLYSFKCELEMLSSLRHPNIISLLGHYQTAEDGLHIVMELGQGSSLTSYLKRRRQKTPLAIENVLRISLDVARGVLFLHSQSPPVVHCDLKSANIILFYGGVAKIADFGIARRVRNSRQRMGVEGVLGTLQWMAPENSDEQSTWYGKLPSDVFSLAVIMWELVEGTGNEPWDGHTMMFILDAIRSGQRLAIPRETNSQFADLITRCWQQDPARRPHIRAVVEDLSAMALEVCGNGLHMRACSTTSHCHIDGPSDAHTDVHSTEIKGDSYHDAILERRPDDIPMSDEGYVQEVVEALVSGTETQQQDAILSLMSLAHINLTNQEAIRRYGGIRHLVRLLTAGSAIQKEQAAAALCCIAFRNEVNQNAMREAGIVSPVVSMLRSGSDSQKVQAAALIRDFTRKNQRNQDALCACGVIDCLVSMMHSQRSQHIEFAVGALRSLAYKNRTNQNLIFAAGAVDVLASVVRDGTDPQKEQAAGALRNLALDNKQIQDAICSAHVVRSLVHLVSRGNEGQKLQAVGAVRALAANNLSSQIALHEAGVIQPLVHLAKTGNGETMRQAAGALGNLASINRANQEAIRAAGAIPPLVSMAKCGAKGARVFAAAALWNLTFQNKANQIALQEAGGIEPLVEMARAGTKLEKKHAATALLTLVCENQSCHDRMLEAVEPLTALLTLAFKRNPSLDSLIADEDPVCRRRSDGEIIQVMGGLFVLMLGQAENRNLRASMEPMVALMIAGTEVQKEIVVAALWDLAWGNQSLQDAARLSSAFEPLVTILHRGTRVQKYLAAGAVLNLVANNEANQIAMINAGVIEPLVELLYHGCDGHREQAAGALAELACSCAHQRTLLSSIKPLSELVRFGTALGKANAARALGTLALADKSFEHRIYEAGVILPLIALVSDGTDEQKFEATRALGALSLLDPPSLEALRSVTPVLIRISRAGAEEQRFWARTILQMISLKEQ